MLRCVFFVVALLAAVPTAARADGPLAEGKWLLSYGRTAAAQQVFCILQVEAKAGQPTATVLASPPGNQFSVKEFKTRGKSVTITLNIGVTFTGTAGSDPKMVLGSFGNESVVFRARLTQTAKESLTRSDLMIRTKVPEAFSKAQQLASQPALLRFQARREQDADKKKELLDKANAAQKEADEQVPKLYREVIAQHANSPAALDASLALLRSAASSKVKPAEAAKLVKVVEQAAKPYGPRYARTVTLQAAEALVDQKGMEGVAVSVTESLAKKLKDTDPASNQVQVLALYKRALTQAGKKTEAKAVEARLTKLETALDKEYLAKMPPFKPTPFGGRKAGANKMAVMELFTGAQCPPCVAADVAFDALEKSYPPTDLVLIEYHMHIPGPDPLTNPDTIARWDYYRKLFPSDIRGTPSTIFNGKPQAGGGGGMANSEGKYRQYRAIIGPILEEMTAVKVTGKATRSGDRLAITVEVSGAPAGEDLRLRLLVVEEAVRYVGGNKIRFHHQVVRAMPGGPAGVAVTGATFRHQATVDLAQVRAGLRKYLDHFASTRPFPNPNRPMAMKRVRVIALVQSDKTGEILQAAQFETEGGSAAGASGLR